MKIRLEPQKTTLRLSKVEFSELLRCQSLSDSFKLPGSKTIEIQLSLNEYQKYIFDNDVFHISLPNHIIEDYIPKKKGLSFYFQKNNEKEHQLLFEVDIKKKPINK